MNDPTPPVTDLSTDVQWMWNTNQNSLDEFNRIKLNPYSDVENRIIKEAFTVDQTHAILDNYRIDFKSMSQISINEDSPQRSVKRVTFERDEKYLREQHDVSDPILPLWQLSGSHGWIPVFIQEVRKALKLEKRQLLLQDKTIISIIVEKAALGIIKEGEKMGRSSDAEPIAQMLREQRGKEMQEVWKCCAYLYTLNIFLFQILNETMRLIGSEQYETVWRSKIETLGPFCLLLWDDPFNNKPNTSNQLLYRGANIPVAMIKAFKDRSSNEYGTFQAFTSCTRNRRFAEIFGNTVFIMKVKYAFTMDISPFSNFPEEEEVLVAPGVCFTMDHVVFDTTTNKYLIYLELDYRLNDLENLELSNESKGASINNSSAFDNYLVLRDRNGDIIADDIDVYILRVHHCDLSADYFYANVSFGLVRPIRKPFSSRRHVYIHPPAAASRRNTLVRSLRRIRSPDDNDVRPHSPDNIYRLNFNN